MQLTPAIIYSVVLRNWNYPMQMPGALRCGIEREIDAADAHQLKSAAEALSTRYREGKTSGGTVVSLVERLAYLATRMPATFTAVASVLSRLEECLPGEQFESILDLGSGPGTAIWAASHILGRGIGFTVIERDREFGSLGKRLALQSNDESVRNAVWKFEDLRTSTSFVEHDVVLLSYSLGELSGEDATKVTEKAFNAARKAVIIIEPGSPRGFETVIAARSTALRWGGFVAAPCPHQNACPLVGSDWCHFSARLERPSWEKRLKGGSLPYEDEKYSYVIISRSMPRPASSRIISRPNKLKSHVRLTLCTPDGIVRMPVGRSSQAYRAARKAEWGEEWSCPGNTPGQTL